MSKKKRISRRPPAFKVRVTQEHIEFAIPANSGHCMIADAVRDSYFEETRRKALRVAVDLQTIRFTDDEAGCRYVYLTPSVGQKGLIQFDHGIKPTPFHFKLRSGQVIKKKQLNTGRSKRSEAQQKVTDKLVRDTKAKHKRAKAKRLGHDQGDGSTRTIVGGKAPPTSVLTGNRRQFGVRAIGNINSPTQERT